MASRASIPRAGSRKKKNGIRLYGQPPRVLRSSAAFQGLMKKMLSCLDEMFGVGSFRPGRKRSMTMFVNCPNGSDSWTVPFGWHTDVPLNPDQPEPSTLFAYAFIDRVE